MGSGKQEKERSKSAPKFPKSGRHKKLPLGPNRPKTKKPKKINIFESKTKNIEINNNSAEPATPSQQLSFFLNQYQSSNGIQLSSLERESIKDRCILELPQSIAQDTLGEHMKTAFGPSWKQELCENQITEGKIEPGNPALLVISLSALRSLELYRGLRPLTKECHAAKLFSKHMKVEDQVSFLKNRVNIASGTPSRIKKLIDMEALGLSRLQVIVLDMHTDVKGYSLFSLPQIRDEFWDLYKSHFHQRLVQGDLRICLYGSIPVIPEVKKKISDD